MGHPRGTIELAIPKLRSGSYFPDWLLERRKRALTTVVATCYLLGVSTRRMERLVETLGITRLSKNQVSAMTRELDEHVESFRSRPLDAGPYTFIAADALVLKVREGGRVVNVHTLLATGVNADGHREILGREVTSGEDGAGWLAFFRGLVARGLTGAGSPQEVEQSAEGPQERRSRTVLHTPRRPRQPHRYRSESVLADATRRDSAQVEEAVRLVPERHPGGGERLVPVAGDTRRAALHAVIGGEQDDDIVCQAAGLEQVQPHP